MALSYPFSEGPKNHQCVTVHPHVKWVRSPLPFSLAHINCYLLKDGDGWFVVDTGMQGKEAIATWESVLEDTLNGDPITGVIATHHHPDHIGLAGWFCDKFSAPFYTTEAEYYYTRTFHAPKRKDSYWETVQYFDRSDMNEDSKNALLADTNYTHLVADVPSAFHRLVDGETITIGNYTWNVITTRGHSPEHLSLFCEELDLYISGDQVLPKITSNVSVSSTQALANPLKDWFFAHEKIRKTVSDSVLVLPAHQLPFKGLHYRLQEVLDHHYERLDKIETLCKQAMTAQVLTKHLFDREMDAFQNFLAVGECVAHLNWLLEEGRVQTNLSNNKLYYQSI